MTNLEALPWDHSGVYAIRQKVELADVDQFNHVNNAVYVAWQDKIAWAHSTHLGFPIERNVALGVGWVVHENRAKYELPAKLDDDLALGTWVLSNDDKLRCERGFQFIRLSDQKTAFRGTITYVTFDLKRQKLTRMPEELRLSYQAFKRDP